MTVAAPPPVAAGPDLVERLAGFAALVVEPADSVTDPVVGVLEIVVSAVPGAVWAALSERSSRGRSRTVAATDSLVGEWETAQFRLGEGPILEALTQGATVLAADLHDDDRWPRLAAHHVLGRSPVRGVLSRPLRLPGSAARTVTLYGRESGVFGPATGWVTALTLASMETALAGLTQRTRAANLHRALMSNRRIGVATGILMAHRQWNEVQALAAMGEASQALNRKLRDLAEDVMLTGELPDLPTGSVT